MCRLQVSFTAKNRQLGTDAVGSLTVNPKNTVSQLKRLLGKRFRDPQVQADLKLLPYKVSHSTKSGGSAAILSVEAALHVRRMCVIEASGSASIEATGGAAPTTYATGECAMCQAADRH